MAKRVGNVSTVADLRAAGVSAAALRHFVFIDALSQGAQPLGRRARGLIAQAVRRGGRLRRPARRGETPAARRRWPRQPTTLVIAGGSGALRRPERACSAGRAVRLHHGGERATWTAGRRSARGRSARRSGRRSPGRRRARRRSGARAADARARCAWIEGAAIAGTSERRDMRRGFCGGRPDSGEALQGTGIAIEDTRGETRWKKLAERRDARRGRPASPFMVAGHRPPLTRLLRPTAYSYSDSRKTAVSPT